MDTPCSFKTRIREGFAAGTTQLNRTPLLFAESERAGKRAAAIQTLLGTAKLNGLDPAAWLRDTLERLPICLNSQIDSLLPLRAKPLLQASS